MYCPSLVVVMFTQAMGSKEWREVSVNPRYIGSGFSDVITLGRSAVELQAGIFCYILYFIKIRFLKGLG